MTPDHHSAVRQRLPAAAGALAAIVVASLLATSSLAAQQPWSWQGRIAPGQTLEVSGVRGDVRAIVATGAEARVVATTSAAGGFGSNEVRIVVIPHADGVTICALQGTARRQSDDECRPGSGISGTTNDPERVDFEVQVPAGVNFAGRTVTGLVEAVGLDGDVIGSSVSGAVRISTAGSARASTVSGPIDVRLASGDRLHDTSFTSVSGRINMTVAGELNADVRIATLSGRIASDYPITVMSGGGPRGGLEGTIGRGGPRLRFSTVSGDIVIRRD
jgi:hypothetical protein